MDAARIEANREGHGQCPTCDRYIGPVATCPYCDSPSARPVRFAALRAISILLALTGLVLLYAMVTNREIPLIDVADIRPSMNYAYVRITGDLVKRPLISKKYGRVCRISLTLDDTTGAITATAYEKKARALMASGLPEKGDRIEVIGTLSVRNGRQHRIYVDTPRQIRILTSGKDEKGAR
jgi:RecJ-like exonuclease